MLLSSATERPASRQRCKQAGAAQMRRTLYKCKHVPVDMVIKPHIDIPITLINADLGMQRKENVFVLDEKNGVVGHYY